MPQGEVDRLAPGITRYAAGDLRGAAESWRAAVEAAPDDERARAYLAWVESRLAVEQPAAPGTIPAPVPVPIAVSVEATPKRPELAVTPTPWTAAANDEDDESTATLQRLRLPSSMRTAAGPTSPEPSEMAPERRLLSRTPTTPNLAPLDVPILDDVGLATLTASPPPPAAEPAAPHGTLDADLSTAAAAFTAGDPERALVAAERAVAASGSIVAPALAPHAELLHRIYDHHLGRKSRIVRAGPLTGIHDPRAAFLVSRVDGTFSIDDLVEISGMPPLEAVRLVAVMLRQGALLV